MKTIFADTSYYVALLNRTDEYHEKACAYTEAFSGSLVTTAFVLVELANRLADRDNRPAFLSLLSDLKSDHRVEVLPASQDLLDRGIELYAHRPDKDWSLTDCVSFLVMQDRGLVEAATTDHHFEQAGFIVLLK